MPLCPVCGNIDLSALTDTGRPRFPRLHAPGEGFPSNCDLYYQDKPDPNLLIPHHDSLDELKGSAATCEICRLIEQCVDDTLVQFRYARELNFNYAVSGFKFFLAPRPGVDGFQVLARENQDDPDHYYVMGGIGFCVDGGSPSADLVRGRAVPLSPKSPASLMRIRKWVERCRTEHLHDPPDDPKLPTRVLEINSAGSEVLVRESLGLVADYAALSHCWGLDQPTSLNRDTVAQLRAGVKTDTLPQSFQDAVWLAHQLGIRYLWIDSLCIFQDDSEDWARESARMSEVYGHATITIAASRAASCTEGFLGDRTRPELVSIPMRATPGASHPAEHNIQAFILPKKYASDTKRCIRLEEEPLSSRGWAFQERHLSPRVLHFGHRQTFFECPGSFEPEDCCSVDGTHVNRIFMRPSSPRGWDSYEWATIVREYSRRKLTFPEDKLPALAGLARHLAETPPADADVEAGRLPIMSERHYLAGLRRDNIIQDLCWHLDRHESEGVRPPTYRAPSWSWASMDGCIEYGRNYGTPLAIARDAHVELDTAQNPLGKVKGGWLYLQAMRLVHIPPDMEKEPADRRFLEFREEGVSFWMFASWDAEAYTPVRDKDWNDPEISSEIPELLVIPLAWDRETASRGDSKIIFGPFCLIVTEIDGVERVPEQYEHVRRFRRLGAGLVQTQHRKALAELLERWTAAREKGELEDMLLF